MLPLKENLYVIGEEDTRQPQSVQCAKAQARERDRELKARSWVGDRKRKTGTSSKRDHINMNSNISDHVRKGSRGGESRNRRIRKGIVFRDEDFEARKNAGIILYG